MAEAALLHCPIRGPLRVRQRAKDDLTFTEEKRRIDAIRFLLGRDYPPEHFGIETTLFKFGHEGRNSFRVDFSVYEEPYNDIRSLPLEERRDHIRLVAEVKRANESASQAKATQVRPAIGFIPNLAALGVYWDDIEQRFFYRKVTGQRAETFEAPINKIPDWGLPVESTRLSYADLDPAKDLVRIFDELEDVLHPYIADKAKRYAVLQQLLLTKIHDENLHQGKPTAPLDVQDFSIEPIADSVVIDRMNRALKSGLAHYQRYLPEPIPDTFRTPAVALREATKILAPVNVLRSKKNVIQAFYMKFAKNLYKWDLAQYFTPHEVIDFIVDVVNPQYGEHVKDPACGSADFLVSAFRHFSDESIWGSDNSEQAVQISVLNMVLNGDGKSNITHEDSLEAYGPKSRQFKIVLCNPPFGVKILERRLKVLNKFDLGHEWETVDGVPQPREAVRAAQQSGILFAELCIRLAQPGGRVAVILPNGYLGNASLQYAALREWLLRHARLVGVVGFPRFTFKKSGADVSASVLFLERRKKSLNRAAETEDYPVYVGLVESVGWKIGDKRAEPVYRREPDTGALILNPENEPEIDTDFPAILAEFLRSPAAHVFGWLMKEREAPPGPQGYYVSIRDLLANNTSNFDPKRHCEKYRVLRTGVASRDHFSIGDVLEKVATPRPGVEAARWYRYVEIESIGIGDFDYEEVRGWQLPDRARLVAEPRDIFIAHIWSSVGKWFMAAGECEKMLVTSGCTRFRVKPGREHLIPDLVCGLCSEVFRVQMRALATGSDGLADIATADILQILLPSIPAGKWRTQIEEFVTAYLRGMTSLAKAIDTVIPHLEQWPRVPKRRAHTSLV